MVYRHFFSVHFFVCFLSWFPFQMTSHCRISFFFRRAPLLRLLRTYSSYISNDFNLVPSKLPSSLQFLFYQFLHEKSPHSIFIFFITLHYTPPHLTSLIFSFITLHIIAFHFSLHSYMFRYFIFYFTLAFAYFNISSSFDWSTLLLPLIFLHILIAFIFLYWRVSSASIQ